MSIKNANRMTRWGLGVAIVLAQGLVGAAASALPILSEVYYDAVGSDDGQVFVEIYGTPGSSLEGYSLEGVNGTNGDVGPTIALSGVVGATGLFVVADQTSEGTSSIAGADLLANFDFQNGPDSVVLRIGELVVDALGYGDFGGSEVFAGEGSAAPDGPAGSSLARHFANVDTDDNFADFFVASSPTPGVADFAPIPEPGGALLLGLGLSGLAAVGGRQSRASRPTLPATRKRISPYTARNFEDRQEEPYRGQEDRLVLFPQGLNVLHSSVQVSGRKKDRDQGRSARESQALGLRSADDCQGIVEGDRRKGQEARRL
jgi:hypothetical protein